MSLDRDAQLAYHRTAIRHVEREGHVLQREGLLLSRTPTVGIHAVRMLEGDSGPCVPVEEEDERFLADLPGTALVVPVTRGAKALFRVARWLSRDVSRESCADGACHFHTKLHTHTHTHTHLCLGDCA